MQPLETLILTMLILFLIVTGRMEKILWFVKNKDIKSRKKEEDEKKETGSGKSNGKYIPI